MKAERTAVAVTFNARTLELLKGLDALYGDSVDEKVGSIVCIWFSDYRGAFDGVDD